MAEKLSANTEALMERDKRILALEAEIAKLRASISSKPLTLEDFEFDVIDNKTGEIPDLEHIALYEKWAKGLMYCDMDGFAITEDGTLILMDDCGRLAYCPDGRFKVALRTKPEAHGRWIYMPKESDAECGAYKCSMCNERFVEDFGFEEQNFCPNCGARMDGGERE
jgi:hypothetical protein